MITKPIKQIIWLACLMIPFWVGAQAKSSFTESSASTRVVAEKYFTAYIKRDWDTLEPLLAPEGSFIDLTAEPIFGKVENIGKEATIQNFRVNYSSITHMEFEKTRAFFSGKYGVFEGTLDWTIKVAEGQEIATKAMPFVAILKVENEQIVEHKDFADYAPFIEGVKKLKKKK